MPTKIRKTVHFPPIPHHTILSQSKRNFCRAITTKIAIKYANTGKWEATKLIICALLGAAAVLRVRSEAKQPLIISNDNVKYVLYPSFIVLKVADRTLNKNLTKGYRS